MISRVGVVGAGAIGCLLAALLSQGGCEVALVGRPDQVSAIRRRGLVVRDAGGSERTYRLETGTELPAGVDLVLLTVKTQDVEAACREIASTAPGVPVVALQNGVQADHIAAGVLGRENVLGGVVVCSASYESPGEITLDFRGWLVLGEPFQPVGERLDSIATVLRTALPVCVTRDLAAARWTKLIGNLNNGLCAVTGQPLVEIVRSRRGAGLAVRVMREGMHVAHADGQRIDLIPPLEAVRGGTRTATLAVLQSAVPLLASRTPGWMAAAVLSAGAGRMRSLRARGSTWQSLARGRTTEIDYLNGEIVRTARRLGLRAPLNERLVELVHQVERSGEFVPPEALSHA